MLRNVFFNVRMTIFDNFPVLKCNFFRDKTFSVCSRSDSMYEPISYAVDFDKCLQAN